MKQEELLGKINENINFTYNGLDTLRLEGLEELRTFQQVKGNVLKKEKIRLTNKWGAHHPRVKAVSSKIRAIDNMAKDLELLVTEAKTEVKPVEENTWIVHGKVFDKNNKGILGLTIALYDSKNRWQKDMGFGCTDEQGYFSISYSVPEEAGQKKLEDKELFLYILDKKQTILYKDREPLFFQPGHMDYRTIYLPGDGKVCIPPESGPGEPGSGEGSVITGKEGPWVVEGIIKNKSNKPLSKMKVSLFDTKHRFDDMLGSKITGRNGKFKFIFEGEDFRELKEAEVDITLEVKDNKGDTVYTSPRTIRCGVHEQFDLQIPPDSPKEKKVPVKKKGKKKEG